MRISDWSSDVCSSDLVPRTVDDVEGQRADRHRVAVVQPAVRLERLAAHPEACAVLAEPLDPEAVVLVRSLDRHAEFLREHPRLPAMIHMTVGDEDFLDLDPGLLHRILQLAEIAAGIDEGRLARFGTPE